MCQPKYVSKFEEKMKEKRKLVSDKSKNTTAYTLSGFSFCVLNLRKTLTLHQVEIKLDLGQHICSFISIMQYLYLQKGFFAPKITESHVAETCAVNTLKSYLYYGLCAGDNVISPGSSSC